MQGQYRYERYVLLGDNVHVLVVGRLHRSRSQLPSPQSRHSRHALLGSSVAVSHRRQLRTRSQMCYPRV